MRKEPKKGWFSKKKMFPLFIITVMTMSVIGLMWGGDNTQNTLEYKDFNFIRKNSQWSLKVNNIELVFDYFPSEIEDIPISSEIKDKLRGTIEIDITSEANSSYSKSIAIAQYNIEQNLRGFNIYIRKGHTSNNTYNMPIITCNDSTAIVPVVYFKDSNQTKVYIENNCIIAEGSSDADFKKIKDRLIYAFLGIIE